MNPARWTAFLPALFWAAGILWLGSRPPLGGGIDVPAGDKMAHLAMFAGLGYLTARGRQAAAPATPPRLWLLLAGAVGVTDELNQLRIAGRSSDWLDLLADLVGVLLGFAMFHTFHRMRHEGDS